MSDLKRKRTEYSEEKHPYQLRSFKYKEKHFPKLERIPKKTKRKFEELQDEVTKKRKLNNGTSVTFGKLPIPEESHDDLIHDREYIPDKPWKKYFTKETTPSSKAIRFNKQRKHKQIDNEEHYNFQTFTFGLGSRSDEINLYRSTKMSEVKRLKKLHGEKNFLDVETFTPQFSRGFITGGIDTKKEVNLLLDDVTKDSTFKGRKKGQKELGTAVLGREVLTFLSSGYTPEKRTFDFPKPRSHKKTIQKQILSLMPPKNPTITREQVKSIWDMNKPNPSIKIGNKTVFAIEPKSPKEGQTWISEHLSKTYNKN